MKIDLLSTVEAGGCSAKLTSTQLEQILSKIPKVKNKNILVDIETHDDAGVYKINDDTALIFTTDFFPPVCSDPFEFGQIAAANALSDVYAMGGTPLMALNITMFSVDKLPIEALAEILKGGNDKVSEAGAFTLGGHTIDDNPPKFGLAVVGTVHPNKLVTNAGAKVGDKLILSKPLGIGALIAGKKANIINDSDLEIAIEQMKLLNKYGAEVMANYNVKGATDITGFGLLGHSIRMANASKVSFRINSNKMPLLPKAYEITDAGCLPGATFRNLKFAEQYTFFKKGTDINLKMLACDAQTSGGLLMSVPSSEADNLLADLIKTGFHPNAKIIGEVLPQSSKAIYFD